QHLLLATRKIARLVVAALPERREGLVDPLDAVEHGCVITAGMGAGDQILLDRQVLENPPFLEDLGHAALDDIMGGEPVEALAVEFDRAFRYFAAFAVQEA